jgi:hemerythrin
MQTSSDVQSAKAGLEAIDHEHREIIALIEEFHDLLTEGGSQNQIVDLFGVVLAHVRSHFKSEERFMCEVGYGGYAAHKADHDRLLEELGEVMIDCEHGAHAGRHLTLAERVTDWFANHFETMDAKIDGAQHTLQG